MSDWKTIGEETSQITRDARATKTPRAALVAALAVAREQEAYETSLFASGVRTHSTPLAERVAHIAAAIEEWDDLPRRRAEEAERARIAAEVEAIRAAAQKFFDANPYGLRSVADIHSAPVSRTTRRGWGVVAGTDGRLTVKSGFDFRSACPYFLARFDGALIVRLWPPTGVRRDWIEDEIAASSVALPGACSYAARAARAA